MIARLRALLVASALALTGSTASTVLAQSSDNPAADLAAGAWLLYQHKFVQEDGRVIDNRAGAISHSESQGYGMLMAVIADDRSTFDRIWAWTRANLIVRQDGLAAWRWDPKADPHITDLNNATDGDLLMAWALQKAGQKWNDPAYTGEALRIVDAIVLNATVATDHGRILLPGASGFRASDQPDGPVVNLSYWIFPALGDLGQLTGRFPGRDLIDSGLQILRTARFGPARLPPDWVSLAEATPRPASQYPSQFGYDAIRVPLYLAWYSRDYPDILEVFAEHWRQFGPASMSVVELATATRISPMPDPGYRAVALLVDCSLGRRPDPSEFNDTTSQDYYPSTLHVLSLMAIAERYPTCLTDFH